MIGVGLYLRWSTLKIHCDEEQPIIITIGFNFDFSKKKFVKMDISKSLLEIIQLNAGDFMCTSIMKQCQKMSSQNRIIRENSLDFKP